MDVLKKQAFVHTGMFAGRLVEHGMIHREFLAAAKRFKRKQITGPPRHSCHVAGGGETAFFPARLDPGNLIFRQ